jgi:hypothetical protein
MDWEPDSSMRILRRSDRLANRSVLADQDRLDQFNIHEAVRAQRGDDEDRTWTGMRELLTKYNTGDP